MKIFYKNGQTSIILRVRIADTTSVIGGGKTGLTFASAGLIISTIADNEATATTYTQAAGTIETVTTLGTFAAPTATKCRFREVDPTNMPGLYEIQIADARWAVSGARSLIISLPPVSGLGTGPVFAEVQLTAVDPQDATAFGLSRIDAAISSRSTYAGGAVASVTGDVGGNVVGSVGSVLGNVVGSVGNLLDISAAALARFFTRDSGSTYAASVAGSVVREIASNAATSVATIAGAVWNALRASYVVSGSFGEGIATILTQTGLFGTTALTMNAPQFNSLNYPLVAGRTYAQQYGNALQFVLANTSIDLTDPDISFSLNLKPNGTPTVFVGTALTSQTGFFEVDADDTADWVTTANTDGLRVYGDIVVYSGVDPDPIVPIDVTVGWLKVVPGVNNS